MADVVQTPHADASSIPMQSTSQASLVQRIWRAKRYYLYLVPIFALLGVFSYYPPLMALYYSFTNYDGLSGKFIGLENFTDLASDRIFRASIKNAVILLFANTVTGVIPPLLVAEMLFSLRSRRMGDFYRTAFLIPTLVPAIVIIMTWRYIYHARYGLIFTVVAVALVALMGACAPQVVEVERVVEKVVEVPATGPPELDYQGELVVMFDGGYMPARRADRRPESGRRDRQRVHGGADRPMGRYAPGY